jgi:hypothetical protein
MDKTTRKTLSRVSLSLETKIADGFLYLLQINRAPRVLINPTGAARLQRHPHVGQPRHGAKRLGHGHGTVAAAHSFYFDRGHVLTPVVDICFQFIFFADSRKDFLFWQPRSLLPLWKIGV